MSILYGFSYIGTDDPALEYGPIPYGFQWRDTGTNTIWERDPTGSNWVASGLLGTPNLGMLPVQGGPVMGPITGPSGLAELTSADFDNLLEGGLPVGTKTYIDQQVAALKAMIQKSVQAALLGSATVNNIRSNVAMANGVATADTSDVSYYTIVPSDVTGFTYPDGQIPDASDCIVFPYPARFGPWPDTTGSTVDVTTHVNQKPGDPMSWQVYLQHDTNIYAGRLGFTVLAFRSN